MSAVALADTGDVGLLACAVIDTAATLAYAWLARGGQHPAWWRSPFGLHLMCFMAAFAWVLDLSVIHMLTTSGILIHRIPLATARDDWFAWLRVGSFTVLIPVVLAWRLWIILRPPGRKDQP